MFIPLTERTQTEMETEQNSVKLQISLPTNKPSALLGWLTDQVTILAEAFAEPMTAARLKVYAGDLADLERSQLEVAFYRARRELTFFPKIAELRKLAGAGQEEQQDAEARKAWDLLTRFVTKYVSNDVHGNYGPEHGWYPKSFPKLSERILDCVRRTGGWKVYACMDVDDMPFIQKRFFEEYAAWTAVERITDNSRLIQAIPEFKQLVAPSMEQPKPITATGPKPKPVLQPLTESQVKDRREMLRQQTEKLLCKKQQPLTESIR
jgi:predicted nucleotidyltransferase component of viral defense system